MHKCSNNYKQNQAINVQVGKKHLEKASHENQTFL